MMVQLLILGLLQRAGGFLSVPPGPAGQTGLMSTDGGGISTPSDPAMPELDPQYRFLCVWRRPGATSVFPPSFAARNGPLDLPPGDTHVDPCFLGLKKFAWAIILTGLSLVGIILCIPLLLVVSRRRPPGQPLFPDCCCDGCCAPKRQPLPPPLQFSA
mmetsp:Transcript_115020/g.358175  ORF Transcript_115020/g.358175 Transcript_115020/m.358175 type:complete len:158 (+) Transcript_115020:189-662(+)